jgi:hypothetical protein
LYHLPELELRLTAGVIGRQGMLTSPSHLISPLLFAGVRLSLIFTVDCFIYLTWTLILTADFSVYLTKHTDFDSGFFRLPD